MNLTDYFKWKKANPYKYLSSFIEFEKKYADELARIKESLYREYMGVEPVWGDEEQ